MRPDDGVFRFINERTRTVYGRRFFQQRPTDSIPEDGVHCPGVYYDDRYVARNVQDAGGTAVYIVRAYKYNP